MNIRLGRGKRQIGYLLGLFFLTACGGESNLETKAEKAPLATIELLVAAKGSLSGAIQIPGELIAHQQVDLYAKVNSFVQKLYVDVGSEVKQGQLLAAMDAPEINAQLSGAASRLEALDATFAASKANYERLLETSKTPGTISPNELDQAFARQKSDFAQLQAAKAFEKEIYDNKGYLTIRAPFSGIITARNVSSGAYVGPAGKGSELPIFTLQEHQQLRLVVAVPESYSQYLSSNSVLNFTIPSMPGEKFSGQIKRMAGALDARIRSQRVEADIDNTSRKLLPGMIANVGITLPAKDSSIVVPKSAVVSVAESIFVIKAEAGKAKRVTVKKGREIDGQVEIFGDVKPGDNLVKIASDEIREGQTL